MVTLIIFRRVRLTTLSTLYIYLIQDRNRAVKDAQEMVVIAHAHQRIKKYATNIIAITCKTVIQQVLH